MILIEKSSIYLSNDTEAEFERYLRIIKKEQVQTVEALKEMAMDGVESYTAENMTKHSYKVTEMRTSIHSYMLVASSIASSATPPASGAPASPQAPMRASTWPGDALPTRLLRSPNTTTSPRA